MNLNSVSPKELIKVVEKLGFQEVRQKGSHKTFVHTDGRIVTIPFHSNRDVPIGLLNKIIKQDLFISKEEFLKLL